MLIACRLKIYYNQNMINFIKQNKLGSLATTLSLIYMSLGLPSQIIKIWNTHSVQGISVLMFLLLGIQSVAWVAYGMQKKDNFITIPNILGALFSFVVVIEYFILH